MQLYRGFGKVAEAILGQKTFSSTGQITNLGVQVQHAFNLLNFRLVNWVLCLYVIECAIENCWISFEY